MKKRSTNLNIIMPASINSIRTSRGQSAGFTTAKPYGIPPKQKPFYSVENENVKPVTEIGVGPDALKDLNKMNKLSDYDHIDGTQDEFTYPIIAATIGAGLGYITGTNPQTKMAYGFAGIVGGGLIGNMLQNEINSIE